jgi:hypothetical protein
MQTIGSPRARCVAHMPLRPTVQTGARCAGLRRAIEEVDRHVSGCGARERQCRAHVQTADAPSRAPDPVVPSPPLLACGQATQRAWRPSARRRRATRAASPPSRKRPRSSSSWSSAPRRCGRRAARAPTVSEPCMAQRPVQQAHPANPHVPVHGPRRRLQARGAAGPGRAAAGYCQRAGGARAGVVARGCWGRRAFDRGRRRRRLGHSSSHPGRQTVKGQTSSAIASVLCGLDTHARGACHGRESDRARLDAMYTRSDLLARVPLARPSRTYRCPHLQCALRAHTSAAQVLALRRSQCAQSGRLSFREASPHRGAELRPHCSFFASAVGLTGEPGALLGLASSGGGDALRARSFFATLGGMSAFCGGQGRAGQRLRHARQLRHTLDTARRGELHAVVAVARCRRQSHVLACQFLRPLTCGGHARHA